MFGGVEFCACQSFNGVQQAAAHRQAMHPEDRGEGCVAVERASSPVLKGGAVPDRVGGVRGLCLSCHLMIIAVRSREQMIMMPATDDFATSPVSRPDVRLALPGKH